MKVAKLVFGALENELVGWCRWFCWFVVRQMLEMRLVPKINADQFVKVVSAAKTLNHIFGVTITHSIQLVWITDTMIN